MQWNLDWSKVKGAIGTIAPWIAGTLGTPVAGVAVKALCDVLGLDDDKASPDNITAALAGATPEQLLALKQADATHAETMQKLGFEHVEQLERMAVDDRISARRREVDAHDSWTPRLLAFLVTLGFFGVLGYLLVNGKPTNGGGDALLVMLGSLGTAWAAVIAYYFGSSAGSALRDGIIRLKTGGPSTLLRKLNAGDYAGCAAEFGKWISKGTAAESGLTRRRNAEAALFRGEDWRKFS